MRDPPESTTVKAPLSRTNFSDSSAVYFASETESSSSLSNTSNPCLPLAAVASEAMAEGGDVGLRWDRRWVGAIAAEREILVAGATVSHGEVTRGIAGSLETGSCGQWRRRFVGAVEKSGTAEAAML